jgi:hypothetical protein
MTSDLDQLSATLVIYADSSDVAHFQDPTFRFLLIATLIRTDACERRNR